MNSIDNDNGAFPLLAFAGKDISHFFDEHGEVKIHVDPHTSKISWFLPFKPFYHVPPQEEAEKLFSGRKQLDENISKAVIHKFMSQRLGVCSECSPTSIQLEKSQQLGEGSLPWWKDDKYIVGLLTRKPRWIKIMNTMIMRDVTLEVCCEESIENILERYLKFNRHARSYTWKYLGEPLDMKQTLEMNGIPDREEEADRLRLNADDFIPTLTLYFNDDLTEM